MKTQLGELKVADYMTAATGFVDDNEKLVRAISRMDNDRLSVLTVVDESGQVVGILTNSDLVEIAHEVQADLGSLALVSESTQDFLVRNLADMGDTALVGDIMTSPVETVRASDNLVVAARKLVSRRVHQLPVIDEKNRPVGILSTTDFVRAFADFGALLAG